MSADSDTPATAAITIREWMDRFRRARRIAQAWPVPDGADREFLLEWMRGHMAAYVKTCIAQGWAWDRECESDRDELAGWICEDFDLALDECGVAVATSICKAAGWPS